MFQRGQWKFWKIRFKKSIYLFTQELTERNWPAHWIANMNKNKVQAKESFWPSSQKGEENTFDALQNFK